MRGLRPIIVDDMITTGATIEAAAAALLAEGCKPGLIVVATHPVLVAPAKARLHAAGVSRLVVTDSLPPPKGPPFACDVVGLAPLLAQALRRVASAG